MSNKPRPDLKAQRIAEGLERNAHWQALTCAKKIHSLHGRRGVSKRQLTQLEVVRE